jgi:hypothetical protein
MTLSRPAGRGNSDWMKAVICEWVVRYTPSSGSDVRGKVRRIENMFEDEDDEEGGQDAVDYKQTGFL